MIQWFIRWVQGFGGLRQAIQLKERADKAREQREYETACVLYETSLERFQQRKHFPGVLWVRLALGRLAFQVQDYPTARSHFQQCVGLARNVQDAMFLMASLSSLATVAAYQGQIELVERLSKECLELAETEHKPEWATVAYSLLGSVALTSAEARTYHAKALALCREQDADQDVSHLLCSLGHDAEPGRDNREERAYLEKCLEICRVGEDKRLLSYTLNNLGNIERFANNLHQAEQLYHESLVLKLELEDEWAIAYTLEGSAMLAVLREQGERAARLFGAAMRIRERLGTPLEPSKQAEYQENLEKAQTFLDAEVFQIAIEKGKQLSLMEAVVYASTPGE